MIVLHFPAETARRIVNCEQTVVTYPDRRLVWHHGVVPLTDLVGQPVAFAGLPDHTDFDGVNGWFNVSRPVVPGAIVGSGKVAVVVPTDHIQAALAGGVPWPDIDQLPFADFTPGRWAVILTDAAPCEQRCPWPCPDPGPECEPCHGRGTCPPILYDHPGPVSEWTP